jgi:uncharacterized protein YfaS (alpha-2-macroglobulin family)
MTLNINVNHSMRKKLLYALFASTAIVGLFFLVKSQKIVKNEAYFEAVSKYVYAYSGGAVSSSDPLRVRFVNAAVSKEQIGQPVPTNIFHTAPKIEGQAVWEDDRTIVLKPSKPLPFGKKYTARVALQRIYADAPAIASVFEYNFHIRDLAYEVVIAGIAADHSDLKKQEVSGQLHINEACDGAKVEQMLSAKQGNNALQVSWKHDSDGRTHAWTVVGVERSNAASLVNMHWTGKPIGGRKDLKETQLVPPLDEFVVLSARVVQVEEQYVLVNFSDPIAPSQDLSGLIRIEGFTGKLRYVTDGNFVRVYPSERIVGSQKLTVDASIRNVSGQSLKTGSSSNLEFEDLKPGVRLVGRGAIIPQQANGGVIYPFEAVGLSAIDVEVFKIFNSNILQYLQVNELEGEQELERVGKIILQKKFNLSELNPNATAKTWQRYAIDLQDMIRRDPGAIYQVRIAFRKDYTTCAATAENLVPVTDEKDEFGMASSIMGGDRGIYWADDTPWYWGDGDDDGEENPNNYHWDKREDPCAKEYYYESHFVKRNAFVSDLGLTAKLGRDGSLFMAVTDLHTTAPLSGIDIELFTYQLQPIAKIRTESDGTVLLEGLREIPFVAVASGSNRRGYLRMADGNTLSLSRFDVAGTEMQKGLKGFIYGERGVWRPGDSIFLNFVLEDKSGRLPAGHPVTMELTDPRGAMQYRTTTTNSVGGVYPFHCVTQPEAPTGNWTCKVMVGSATFTKTLKIETVKPNRLKLDLDFGKKILAASDFSRTPDGKGGIVGALKVNWLHGAVAKDLKTTVEMTVVARKTEFQNYKTYSFDDPSRYFYAEPAMLYDGNTDLNGQASVPLKIGQVSEAPGKLTANFKVRAFEQGGDFSTDNFSLEVSPYDRYVGVYIPTDKWGSKTVDARGASVLFAMVDKSGKPLANQEVSVALYRVDWRWWWDEDANSGVGNFNSGEVNNALDQATLRTDARGQVSWKVKPDGWGRYFVRITDGGGTHAGGDFFWSGYPEQLDDMASRNAAAMLPFTVDKEKFNVGEEVTLKVPASENGRILLTLETGSRVAKHMWFDAKAGDNLLKFTTEANMAPTVYAHISLLQPHAQTKNDLPIRMYGVMPVNVEDPTSRLQAQIDMPDILKPGEAFNLNLKELGGKACVYTLDIVDEGLLDLTRFKTPNPWDAFYSREALGVKTWDIYDYVLGAYGAELDRILSIGGDGINQKAKPASVNRFKPTVIHVGPFKLEKGQTARHRLQIDNYVGSVRVMAVLSAPPTAGGSGAYGNAEKTCPVRKPLMIMPTLPRVLGPGETLRLPVDVFAMEKSVQNATVTVREKSGLVNVGGTGSTNLSFSEPGEKMTYFDLKVGSKTGVAKFIITAEGGGETATSEIELLVRNPNPIITRVLDGVIEPGQTWSQSGNPTDFTDLTGAILEISSIPPINLSKQLEYLIQYPHGCVEQTTSAAFPQLYVDLIAPLSDKQKMQTEKNIKAAISKLQSFQLPSGGFSYWPGGNDVADWAGTYAGHFLLEAKARGFAVPEQMLTKWVEHQTKTSRTWEPVKEDANNNWWYHDNEMAQAYRLYALAMAGKPDLAGMNRLRESKSKYESSMSLLAAAFATAGKQEAARDLLNDVSARKFIYSWWGYTYGSDLRDQALRLETLTAIGDTKRGLDAAMLVATSVGNAARWYSTQEIATCLRALCKYAKKATFGEKADFVINTGGREMAVNSTTSYYLHNFTESASGNISVKNTSKQKLFARAVFNGRPAVTNQGSEAKNISLSIRYTDVKGQVIDAAKLTQGSDFLAEVTVTRTGDMKFDFNELALTQIFPSGWEILNTRMNLIGGGNSDPMDYQDIRDDRVMTYFDLPFNWTRDANAKQSRTYRIQLNAAYKGRYFLPTVACEAMYDDRIRSSVPGRWVEVI